MYGFAGRIADQLEILPPLKLQYRAETRVRVLLHRRSRFRFLEPWETEILHER